MLSYNQPMRLFLALTLFFLFSCSSAPKDPICPESSSSVLLTKHQADKIQGNVSQFLTDAEIKQEHNQQDGISLWRFSNMPSDSIYYHIGLREDDAIYKTNLGVQTSSINLISDLSGIASGTTNCLWVMDKDHRMRVIKLLVEKK